MLLLIDWTAGLIAASACLGALTGINQWRLLSQAERWGAIYLAGSAILQVVQFFAIDIGLNRSMIGNIWLSWATTTLFSSLIELSWERARRILRIGQYGLLAAWVAYFLFREPLHAFYNTPMVVFALAGVVFGFLVTLHGIATGNSQILWVGGSILLAETIDAIFFAGVVNWFALSKDARLAGWIFRNCCWINVHFSFLRMLRCPLPSSSLSLR